MTPMKIQNYRDCILKQLIILLAVYTILVEARSLRAKRWIKCQASLSSMTSVQSCPHDEETYIKRSQLKRCASVRACGNERCVYHCALNPWGNGTVEVCAPEANITGSYCIQYNPGVGRILKLYSNPCKDCPYKYRSTKAYKYQSCFKDVWNQKSLKSIKKEDDSKHLHSESILQKNMRNVEMKFTFSTVNSVSQKLSTVKSSRLQMATQEPQLKVLNTNQRTSDDVNYRFIGGTMAFFLICSITVALIVCRANSTLQEKWLTDCLVGLKKTEENKDLKKGQSNIIIKEFKFDERGKKISDMDVEKNLA